MFGYMSASLAILAHNLTSSKFKTTAAFFNPGQDKLIAKPELPPVTVFYNGLSGCDNTKEDYEHTHAVWAIFGCCTLQAYSDLYLKTDMQLLCEVFESFQGLCLKCTD
ncbi:hypothetical protein PR048_026765 [Dryococelus australis]|uniref:Uncharacterized protein n=1 Tax=Dryococelus australis TaxID=614101 RepID=A0ABQ9GMB1_9NEOP|nr:hypothetical protein PR048_026765 [Dryococelus australis]